jgi:ABC-type Zn uptake system ZnuABC Zn-binding protein ZnuA
MKKILFALILMGLAFPAHADDKIRIVTTTTTLADFARHVAGDKADIYTVASPKRDIHYVSPNPKDVLKLKKADVFIHSGLDTEPWRNPLLDAAGNPAFLGEGKDAIDPSPGIALLEVPDILTRAEGDQHQFGNPHFWNDPDNGVLMLRNIARRLEELYPERADEFRKNAEAYETQIKAKIAEWDSRLASYRGTPIVTYHRSWPYFARHFGFEVVGQIEPKPGIPPTAKHTAEIIRLMKEKKVPLIIKETYYDDRSSQKVAKEAGAKVMDLAQSVGEVKEAVDYIGLIEFDVSQVEKALRGGDHV